MLALFKLNIEIIRERFKIYGFFNILSLWSVIFILLFGVKFLLFKIDNYNYLSMILITIIFISGYQYIIPENYEKNVQKIKTYFTSLNIKSIETFYMYKNLVIFYIILIYFTIPMRFKYIENFIFFLFITNVLIYIQLICKKKMSTDKYLYVTTFIKAGLIIFTYLYIKGFIKISFDLFLNIYNTVLFLFIFIYLTFENFKNINLQSDKSTSIYFFNLSKKVMKLSKNKDLVFAIRKNLIIPHILSIIISNIFFKKVDTVLDDLFFTSLITFVSSHISIYMDLLNYEKMKVVYFYTPKNFGKFKLEKIINTIYISLIIFITVLLPLSFIIKLKVLLTSYITSIIIFYITTYIIKISIEKDLDFKKIIKSKESIKIFVVSTVFSLITIEIFNIFIK